MGTATPNRKYSTFSQKSIATQIKRDQFIRQWLSESAKNNSTKMLEMMKDQPCVVKEKDPFSGFTALHWAAIQSVKVQTSYRGEGPFVPGLPYLNLNLEIVKYLIEKGAKIDAKNDSGEQPIHYAVASGKLETLKLLVENGANHNAKDNDGNTPLHKAVEFGLQDCVKYLIEHGSDVDSRNERNQTPLMIAVLKSYIGIVKYLIAHGAKIDVEDENGRNIIQMATPSTSYPYNITIGVNDENLIKYLTKSGVNIKT